MRADLEAELSRLSGDADRLGMLAGVLQLLSQDATLTTAGGVACLAPKATGHPGQTGVNDAGSDVAEIAAHLGSGDLYTGVALSARTALSLYEAHVDWTSGINDLEDEHGLDAITRLVGLGLVAEGLSDGDSDAAASAWLSTESGRATLVWFSAVEITLAFGTSEDPIDGDKVLALLDAFFDEAIEAWAEFASERALARARIIVNNWTDFICPVVEAAANNVTGLADALVASIGSQVDGGIDELRDEAVRLGVYLGLVSRHIAEGINGLEAPTPVASTPELSTDNTELEAELKAELERARQEREMLTAKLSASRKSLSAAVEGVREHTEAAGQLLADQERLSDVLLAAAESSVDAGTKGADDAKALSSVRSRATRGLKSVKTAQAALSVAARIFTERTASAQRAANARDQTALLHRRSLGDELACLQQVRAIQQRIISLHGADDAPLTAIDELRSLAIERRSQLKADLNSMRAQRRVSAKSQQSIATSLEVITEQCSALQVEIDREALAKEIARADLKERTKRVKADVAKQTKRQRRLEELEDRQAGGDALVSEVSDRIGDTRAQLARVLASHSEGQKQQEETRKARRKELRKDLIIAQRSLAENQEALVPLGEASETLDAALELKTSEFNQSQAVRDETRMRLKSVTTQQKQLASSRLKGHKLAQAALDMLRNNARRLEEAHHGLHGAQAAADTLRKEHNLATGRIERLTADIDGAERTEKEAANTIELLERSIEQSCAALERHSAKIERAEVRLTQARAGRAQALKAQVELKRSEIQKLHASIVDAKEDREGLAVAEVRAGQAAVVQVESRASAVQRQRDLTVRHEAAVGAGSRLAERLSLLESRIKATRADIEGRALTLRGMTADHRARQGKLTNSEGRLQHLDAAIARSREREDDSVERVADFQNWVERTQASIKKLGRPQESKPKPRTSEPSPSKIDRLLANLKQPSSAIIPDPSAVPEVDGDATMMVKVAALNTEQGAQEQATQILSRSAKEEDQEAATEMFTPGDLLERLAEDEIDHDSTVMMPLTQRRPPRTRGEDEEG